MAKKGKAKSAKFEIEENESGPLDSKPLMVLSSSDDEEANEDLSLKIVEKALLVKAARFSEGFHAVSDDPGVVSVVGLASSSRGGSDVAGTSGGREETDLDWESKKIVKRKKKKTKIEKVKFLFLLFLQNDCFDPMCCSEKNSVVEIYLKVIFFTTESWWDDTSKES